MIENRENYEKFYAFVYTIFSQKKKKSEKMQKNFQENVIKKYKKREKNVKNRKIVKIFQKKFSLKIGNNYDFLRFFEKKSKKDLHFQKKYIYLPSQLRNNSIWCYSSVG